MPNFLDPAVQAKERAICNAATSGEWRGDPNFGIVTVGPPFSLNEKIIFEAKGWQATANIGFVCAARTGYPAALALLESCYEVLRRKDGTILTMQARNDDLLNRSRALSRRLRGMRKHAKQQAAWAAARILELQERIHNQTVRNVALCKRLKEAAKTEGASDA